MSLTLSSCSLPFADKFSWDWQNEIALGHECGEEGLACCIGQEPACFHGLECCANPADSKITMCLQDCGCGQKDNFCCLDEPRCQDGLACANDICIECGEESEPCCNGDSCNEKLLCHAGTCKKCGQAGSPCCESGRQCENETKTDEARTSCLDGICTLCGSSGRVLCSGEQACSEGLMANNGFCIRCGGLNQPCCNWQPSCDEEKNLNCSKGFCSQ